MTLSEKVAVHQCHTYMTEMAVKTHSHSVNQIILDIFRTELTGWHHADISPSFISCMNCWTAQLAICVPVMSTLLYRSVESASLTHRSQRSMIS